MDLLGREFRFDIVLFTLLGLLISVIHWDAFYYAYDTPKWFVFDVVLSLFLLKNRSYFQRIELGWFGLLCCGFLLSVILLSFKAAHTSMAIEFTYRYILTIATAYILLRKYSSDALLKLLQCTVIVSAAGFVLMFYFERYWLERPYNVGSFSTFGFINNLGQVFNIWLPVLVWLIIRNYRSIKMLVLLLPLTIAAVSVLMEASVRACIFGLFLGEGLVFLLMLARDFKRALLFLSTSLALLLGIAAYTFIDGLEGGRLSNKLSQMENVIAASQARLDMFSNTIDMTLDNPMGVGTNNFEYYHPYYAKPGQPGASPYVNEHQVLRTPHNIILKIYSEQGVLGGTIFLAILLWLYVSAIKNAFSGSFYDRWLLVACTALLFHSLLSAVFLTPGSLFFAILLFALIVRRSGELRPVKGMVLGPCSFSGPVVPLVVVVLMIAGSWLLSDFYGSRGVRSYDVGALKLALRLNPSNDRALYALSHIQYRRYRDVAASLDSIEKFIQKYPYHIAANQIKSERLYQLGRYREAMDNTRKLLNYYPVYQKAWQLERSLRNKIN